MDRRLNLQYAQIKGTSTLIVEHYGKNVYSEHEKFIEIIGMRINNIALKNIPWESHNIPITAFLG